jgi:hypothetical protein
VSFNVWYFILPYAAAAVYFLLRKGALERLIEASKKKKADASKKEAAASNSSPGVPAAPKSTPKSKAPEGQPGAFRPGFRDVRWGDPPAGDMTLLKTDGNETLYMRSSDTMRIGEGRLSGINYQYWRGRCAGVFLQIAPGSLDRVVEALTQQYGKPAVPRDGKPKFYWLSLGFADQSTQAMVDGDPERKAGTVVIFSKTIADEKKAEAARTAAAANAIPLGPPTT